MAYPSNRREKKPKPVITDISDTMIEAHGVDLAELDQQIKDLQDAKKAVYANVREHHGKKAAKSLKIAVTLHGLDSEKRIEVKEIDAEAQRMLSIIERGTRNATHVARGAREDVAHDEDGVILEDDTAGGGSSAGEGGDVLPADTESTAARKDEQSGGSSGHEPSDGVEGSVNYGFGSHTSHGNPIAGTQAPPVDTSPTDKSGSDAGAELPAPSVVRVSSAPLRPFCQHLDDLTKCGGYGRVHCHDCLKARADAEGEPA